MNYPGNATDSKNFRSSKKVGQEGFSEDLGLKQKIKQKYTNARGGGPPHYSIKETT